MTLEINLREFYRLQLPKKIEEVTGVVSVYYINNHELKIKKEALFNWDIIAFNLMRLLDKVPTLTPAQQDTTAKQEEQVQELSAQDMLKTLRAFSTKLEQEAQEDFFSILEYPEKALEISEEAQTVLDKLKAFNNEPEQEAQEDEIDTLSLWNSSPDLQNQGMSLEIDMIWKELSTLASNIQYVCMENRKTADRLEETHIETYGGRIQKLEAALNKVGSEFENLKSILCKHALDINQLKKSPTNSIAHLQLQVEQLKKTVELQKQEIETQVKNNTDFIERLKNNNDFCVGNIFG
jgi:hypothetical protein